MKLNLKGLVYMKNRDIANEWFQFAVLDLGAAKFLTGMRPLPLEIICYHCQQSAEKYLKGFIVLNGGKVIKTHDLLILNKDCRQYDKSFSEIEDECVELVDYGALVRYPFNIDLEERDALDALKSAEKIKNFIMARIKE